MAELPGIDLPRLTSWFDRELPGRRHGALTVKLLAGGKSNLTYRISDGTSSWVLRRPPLAHVLPTAHDMRREHRVIGALNRSAVPVPQAIALCEDLSVLGVPFYLMSFVEGVVLDDHAVLAAITPEQATRACEVLMTTLTTLHEVDPAAVGLGDFGKPDGFLSRQVKRWHQQWQASETAERPELAETVDRLIATMPEPAAPGIVHGDYRLTNVMYTGDFSRIAAVVDWEMATIGDPLTDVGLNVVYQELAQSQGFVMPAGMTVERGFLTGRAMAEFYADHSSRDLSGIDWYVAFGYFKLAVIIEGISRRHLAGQTVGEGFDGIGETVPGLLQAALDHLAR